MNEPIVGIGLIVVKNKKVLLGKRKGSHAAGLYSFPGGHLDWFETWSECALRELNEECGEQFEVQIRRVNQHHEELMVTNDIMPEYNKHYITIFMVADWISGDPITIEPHKCEGWDWYDFDQMVKINLANWIPVNLIAALRDEIGM